MAAAGGSGGLVPFVSAFFVTIATTLGTGILGLPVKLEAAGLGPTALVLTFVLLMQLAVAALMVELLQRATFATATAQPPQTSAPEATEQAPGNDEGEAAAVLAVSAGSAALTQPGDFDIDLGNKTAVVLVETNAAPSLTLPSSLPSPPPPLHTVSAASAAVAAEALSMHTLSTLFLSGGRARLFDATVTLHLVSILVSYALAGSMALARLFMLEAYNLLFIAPFVLSLTAFLFVFAKRVAVVVSLLTAVKLVLVLVMVVAVSAIAAASRLSPTDDYTYIMHPFLLSTVALGGSANLMPVMARSVPVHSANAQRGFLGAVSAGLCVCWALNIGWAASVLEIVPQTAAQAEALGLPGGGAASLERAAAAGQISTVPVSMIIDAKFPQFAWISTSVSVFIALSISVSYVIMGTGLKSILESMAAHWKWSSASEDDGSLHQDIIAPAAAVPVGASAAAAGAPLQSPPPTTPGLRAAAALVRLANRFLEAWGVLQLQMTTAASLGFSRTLHAAMAVTARRLPWVRSESGRRALLVVLAFGFVLLVALLNPAGFIVALEIFTSLALNISSGVLVAVMFSAAAAAGALGDPAAAIAWPLPPFWRRVLPPFALASFSTAVLYDVLEASARFIGWPAALWLSVAVFDWLWHARGLLPVVERLLPPAASAAGGGPRTNPFLKLVVYANVAMFESLAVSHWLGVACEASNAAASYFMPLAIGSLLTAALLNELAALVAAVAGGLDAARSDAGAWLLRRAPIGLAYAAGLAVTGGAVALSACGCGASAGVAWWALLVQMCSVAAAYIASEAAEDSVGVVVGDGALSDASARAEERVPLSSSA